MKLILFDMDGTLAEQNTGVIMPGVKEWFDANGWQHVMVATNQGGVGLRHWMETDGFGDPSQYPTSDMIQRHLTTVYEALGAVLPTLVCYRYQSKKSGKWCPVPEEFADAQEWLQEWRKPAPGMLLEAMRLRGVGPEDTLFVGNGEEDKQAAEAAGCTFQSANAFFGRNPSIDEAREKYIQWLEEQKTFAIRDGDDERLRALDEELHRVRTGATL